VASLSSTRPRAASSPAVAAFPTARAAAVRRAVRPAVRPGPSSRSSGYQPPPPRPRPQHRPQPRPQHRPQPRPQHRPQPRPLLCSLPARRLGRPQLPLRLISLSPRSLHSAPSLLPPPSPSPFPSASSLLPLPPRAPRLGCRPGLRRLVSVELAEPDRAAAAAAAVVV